MNSREKGKRGERLWRDFLRDHGFQARRGQQFSGSPESPDVICPDLPTIHWEVKHVENLNIRKAMAQAEDDAGDDQFPVVAHKTNRSGWLITLKAEDFFRIIKKTDLVQRRTMVLTDDPEILP